MRMLLGGVIVILGIILVLQGLDASEFLGSRISGLFKESPTNRTLWLLGGGLLAVLVGMSIAGHHRPHQRT